MSLWRLWLGLLGEVYYYKINDINNSFLHKWTLTGYCNTIVGLRTLFDEQVDAFIDFINQVNNKTELSVNEKIEVLCHGFVDEPIGGNSAPQIDLRNILESYCEDNPNEYIFNLIQNDWIFFPHASSTYEILISRSLYPSIKGGLEKEEMYEGISKIVSLNINKFFLDSLLILRDEGGDYLDELISFLKPETPSVSANDKKVS
jgi:hypothetical protein